MKLTTIIPIHEMNEELSTLFIKALESVVGQKKYNVKDNLTILIPVAPAAVDEVNKVVAEYSDQATIEVVTNTEDTSFQGQINFAAKKVESEYFTILEFDDEISETYYYNVAKHAKHYGNVDIFLPIIIESKDEDKAIKLTNETCWSRSFVGENGEIGYLNADALNQYTDFKICGSILKTEEFINSGMLKTNIELTFQYEFLLRMLMNGSNVYIIPKIGCKHLVTREGSLFDRYSKTLTLKERQFWFNTAKKEANFPSDREIDTSELLSVAE